MFLKKVDLKIVFRILAVVLIIFFFVPVFTVSCAGASKNVSASGAMVGIKVDGRTVSEPQIGLIILLLIPIAILVIWCISKIKAIVVHSITIVATAIDMIAWNSFKKGVEEFCVANLCTFEVKWLFTFCIIIHIVMLVGAVLLLIGIVGSEGILDFVQESVGKKKCPSCSKRISQAANYCKFCGEPVSEQAVAFTRMDLRTAARMNCPQCGTSILKCANYCGKCGIVVTQKEEQ